MASKILTGPSSFGKTDKTPMNRLIAAGFEMVDNPYKRKLTKKELLDLFENAVVGLIAGLETLDREVLEKSGI